MLAGHRICMASDHRYKIKFVTNRLQKLLICKINEKKPEKNHKPSKCKSHSFSHFNRQHTAIDNPFLFSFNRLLQRWTRTMTFWDYCFAYPTDTREHFNFYNLKHYFVPQNEKQESLISKVGKLCHSAESCLQNVEKNIDKDIQIESKAWWRCSSLSRSYIIMKSRRTFKLDHDNKQTVAQALRTIVEQTCVQELDRGESYFGRANVEEVEKKNNNEEVSSRNGQTSWPKVSGILAAKRQFMRKKVRWYFIIIMNFWLLAIW